MSPLFSASPRMKTGESCGLVLSYSTVAHGGEPGSVSSSARSGGAIGSVLAAVAFLRLVAARRTAFSRLSLQFLVQGVDLFGELVVFRRHFDRRQQTVPRRVRPNCQICRATNNNPSCGIGSNLWSWQRAQVTVRPRKPLQTTSMRSLMMSLLLSLKRAPEGQKAQRGQRALVLSRGQSVGGDLLEDEIGCKACRR